MGYNCSTNPWKGLNFYVEGEIIYGRDSEILNLSHYIFNNTQTVLYGRSGIGKSSILNAGIFPEARRQNMVPVTVRLKHDGDMSYTNQIKQLIKESGIEFKARVDAVDEGRESLWEFIHRHDFVSSETGNPVVPLIVFDQFEEIFTLQSDEHIRKAFFNELADLFNDVKPLYIVEHEVANTDTSVRQSTQSIDTDAFKGLNLSLKIKRGTTDGHSRSKGYVETPSYHMVFALREDFLSSLEIYAHNIPVMKNNRFPLLPINEEQAADIIMRPRPDIVAPDVAKLIIEKVTERTDFTLDGIPEIEVDSAILSLYLSRLYDKMVETGEKTITSDLLKMYGDNIIEEFYVESIKGLPEESVDWIENTLVNKEGRRDNRDRSTMLDECGLSVSELDRLIDDVKILREFPYAGSLRIELIHDVLCPVIVKHRKERIDQLMLKEIETKTKREKRNILIRTIIVASLIVVIIGVSAVWLVRKNLNTRIVDQQQNLVLSLVEDETVTDMDFWKANLTVVGKYASGRDTVLCDIPINKSEISEPITINTDSCLELAFALDFGDFSDIGKYENQNFSKSVSEIISSPYLKLTVRRDKPNYIDYAGRIRLDVNNIDIPLERAIVMIGDAVAISDSAGNFVVSVESTPTKNTTVMIAKGGLGCYELPILASENAADNVYMVIPSDSLGQFIKKAADMDTVSRWNYKTVGEAYCANKGSKNGIHVTFADGHEDRLMMYWKSETPSMDKIPLTGYFYFKNQKDAYDATGAGNGKYAYYIGSGYIDRKVRRDENDAPYRNFEFKGYDAASNVRTVTGKYYRVNGAGKYSGVITSNNRQIGGFGHSQN